MINSKRVSRKKNRGLPKSKPKSSGLIPAVCTVFHKHPSNSCQDSPPGQVELTSSILQIKLKFFQNFFNLESSLSNDKTSLAYCRLYGTEYIVYT